MAPHQPKCHAHCRFSCWLPIQVLLISWFISQTLLSSVLYQVWIHFCLSSNYSNWSKPFYLLVCLQGDCKIWYFANHSTASNRVESDTQELESFPLSLVSRHPRIYPLYCLLMGRMSTNKQDFIVSRLSLCWNLTWTPQIIITSPFFWIGPKEAQRLEQDATSGKIPLDISLNLCGYADAGPTISSSICIADTGIPVSLICLLIALTLN